MKGDFILNRRNTIFVIAIIMLFATSGCGNKKMEAKAKVMADYLSSCDERTRYGIYDLNGDGRAEILIAEGDSHADGVTVGIYNEKTNSVNEVGIFGSFGSMNIIPEKGYIISGYTGQGVDETQIYEITSDGVEVIADFWDNSGTIDKIYEYKLNEVDVSEQEYHDAYVEYCSGENLTIGYSDFEEISDYDSNFKQLYNMITDVEGMNKK